MEDTEINQPTINIGLLGHVANGKSSLIRCITGEKTARGDSRCMSKGESREMTIQVGYSNAKIYQCGSCPKPDCYAGIEGSKREIPVCKCCKRRDNMKLVQFVSFVDNPGHRSLMKNMISGSTVIDNAILVVDANVDAAQIQTIEHLTVGEIIGVDHYITIIQNKIDLLFEDDKCEQKLLQNQEQINELTRESGADLSRTPVIPACCSPVRQINLQLVLQYIVERAKPVSRTIYAKYPLFIHCIRSFDINKPCSDINFKGGVIGGSIMNGILRIGDMIEIRPGYKDKNGVYQPFITQVTSLFTGNTPLKEARRGGLIGIGTTIDPTFTRADAMTGMCAGTVGNLPEPKSIIEVKVFLLRTGIGQEKETQAKVSKLKRGDVLQLSVGAGCVYAKVLKNLHHKVYRFETGRPVCPISGQNIPLSKQIEGSWTIIGKGVFGNVQVNSEQPDPKAEFVPYTELLTRTLDEHKSSICVSQKLSIPPPKLIKEGNVKLLWTNFVATCKQLNREEGHLQAFFDTELSTQTTINAERQLVIHGRNKYQPRHFQTILVKYINSCVTCPYCHSTRTELNKEKHIKHSQLHCGKCGAEFIC